MTLESLRLRAIRWRIVAGLGVGTALVGPVLFATSVIVGTADGTGTISQGEYAGQTFTVHLGGEYSGVGLGTLTSGAGTFIQIGSELFEGIVSPDFGTFQSLCCGNGGVVGSGFFLHGQVRHAGHNHLFDASATTDGTLCFTLSDQTGTIVTPAVPPHDPHLGGLICVAGAVALGVPVAIDIRPGVSPNTINPGSRGLIPVAILSTDDFDATTVDPLSVRFGPAGAAEAHGRGHVSDVNGDGRPDLVLHFATQATGIVAGDTSASLTGTTFDGEPIQGSGAIVTVGG